MKLADISVPDSAAARSALEVAERFYSPALLNHCLRSYLWAASYGSSHDVRYDTELLYVASLLHDIGLVPDFDSHVVPFERAGGELAWVFAAGAGWPDERRERARQIVVAHMQATVDPAVDPEGHLLEVATSLDISGADPQAWPADLTGEVLAAYPRLGLSEEFGACLVAQATRKPGSSAARIVTNGLLDRLAANPLER